MLYDCNCIYLPVWSPFVKSIHFLSHIPLNIEFSDQFRIIYLTVLVLLTEHTFLQIGKANVWSYCILKMRVKSYPLSWKETWIVFHFLIITLRYIQRSIYENACDSTDIFVWRDRTKNWKPQLILLTTATSTTTAARLPPKTERCKKKFM